MQIRSFICSVLAIIFLMLSTLFLSSSVSAQQFNGQILRDAPPPATSVEEIISRFELPDAPGAGVAVMKDGEILHLSAFGKSNLETGDENTIRTPFDLASLSKQFTGYAIAMLVDAGTISLDDDIRDFFPEFKSLGDAITIDQLVHHTSGLREMIGMLSLSGWTFQDHATNEDVIQMISRQKSLLFTPGERYAYSNTNYTLLAEIIARSTGVSFAEWTRTNIFDPLGMTNSGFDDGAWTRNEQQAINYTRENTDFVAGGLQWLTVGAGGMYASIQDLTKWADNVMNGTIGGEAVKKLVRQKGTLNDGSEVTYAFGMIHENDRGLRTLTHGGGAPGVQSGIRIYPDHGFTVIIAGNTGPDVFSMGQMTHQIVDLYLAAEPDQADSGAPGRRPILLSREFFDSTPEGTNNADPSSYDGYSGTYKLLVGDEYSDDLFLGRLLSVSRDDDRLLVAFGEPEGFPLAPIAENRFLVPMLNFELTFHPDEQGITTSLTFHLTEDSIGDEPAQDFRGVKLDNTPLSTQELERFEGNFYGPRLDTTYRVTARNGKLELSHPNMGSFVLEQLTQEEFVSDGHVFTSVKFVRDLTGRPVQIHLTGYSWGTDAKLVRVASPDDL